MPSNYEVWLRDKRTGNRRSIILWAESFADAEAQAMDGSLTRKWFDIGNEEIFKIDKEYETDTHDHRDHESAIL
jgi:hypothetical protein